MKMDSTVGLSTGQVCLARFRAARFRERRISNPMSKFPTQVSDTPLAELIRYRRTVAPKHFNAVAPDHQLVADAIGIACNAPNHHRTEPCRFYLLDAGRISKVGQLFGELVRGNEPTKESIARSGKKAREWGSAPGLLVVTQYTPRASKLVVNKPEVIREDYATCCCIVQNLLLLLENTDISAKWSTGPVWQHPRFRDVVGIPHAPPDEEVVALIFYGKSDLHKEARLLADMDQVLVNFRKD